MSNSRGTELTPTHVEVLPAEGAVHMPVGTPSHPFD